MKKFVSLLFCFLALSLCACNSAAANKTVDMDALSQAMLAADASLPEMKSTTAASDLQYVADLDDKKVDRYFLHYSAVATADEIAVIAMKDAADVDDAQDALQAHLEHRYRLFAEYEPKEVQRIENAVIFTKAQYAVLIICDNADAVQATFENAFND